jgi:nitrite reductase/ring-hydroxylating ferredoxin subunit
VTGQDLTWRDLPGAPPPGTALGTVADLPPGGLAVWSAGDFSILVLDGGGSEGAPPRGFVNLCPHQYLPLDWRADRVLSRDGTRLVCSNHQAAFDAVTGAGLLGLCQGQALIPVPLALDGGTVVIAG